MDREVKIDSHRFELSNLEKGMNSQDGITRQDVIDYYRKVSDSMLPHLKDRPVSMKRFSNGINEFSFYQKEIPEYFPDWIDRVEVT